MLELMHITKTFNPGTANAKTALNDLSLSVPDGDFITIIGSNGAGKSTMLNAISGSFYTDEGTILLDGEDITMEPPHKRSRSIGRLFQDPMLGTAPGMTIEENLTLAAGFPVFQRQTGTGSGKNLRSWTWDWKTGFPSRWDFSPADSGRR